jgi:hypothetical protein
MTPLILVTAITSLNQLLLSPPGQKLLEMNVDLFAKLFTLLHLNLASTTPPTSPTVPK